MYINHDDLVTLATGPSGQGEAILQGLDRYKITFTFFTRFTILSPAGPCDTTHDLTSHWTYHFHLPGLLLSHLFTHSYCREIVSHKRIVQNNKQLLSSLRRKARDRDLAPYRFLHFDSISEPPADSEFLRKKLVAGGSAPYTFNDLVKFHRILIFISKVLILCPGRVLPDPASRINARWTNEELLLAVQV